MIKKLLRLILCVAIVNVSIPTAFYVRPANAQTEEAKDYNPEQLDALLAPIALYPDTLLTQTLMASTFPLQVVSAGRWIEEPANKSLSGDALAKALEAQPWDPSVKSLVPFPAVLALLNGNLDWTQQLGYAFADQQAAVMNSVQRLRAQAQSAGNLKTTEQQVVRVEKETIVIQPAQPSVVYVPSYNPTTVYGAWPYPSYPPVYLPPPPGYAFGSALVSGMAFATGVAVVGSLWGWATPIWGRGNINVNVNHYNNINVHRGQISSNVWQANRPGGRPAGLTRPPAGPVGAPARGNGLSANAIGRSSVNVPGSAVNRPARSGGGQLNATNSPAAPASRQNLGQNRPGTAAANRPNAAAAQSQAAARPSGQRPAETRQPQAFSGMDSGRRAAQDGARGQQSRSSSQFHSQGRSDAGARAGGGGRAGGNRGR